MTPYLFDVNVLIALIDPAHVHHDPAHEWFVKSGQRRWASCPMTQNAVLRIVGHPRYPNTPGTPAAVAPLIEGLCAIGGHEFWSDDVSLLKREIFDIGRLLSSGQVTDSYLLGLARHHGGMLATFDRQLIVDAVRDGAKSLHLIA